MYPLVSMILQGRSQDWPKGGGGDCSSRTLGISRGLLQSQGGKISNWGVS